MPVPEDSLVAVLVSKLDENLREDWEERASIMQFDALLPKGYAECLAMLDLLCRHPEVLDRTTGLVILQFNIDGETQWLLSADSNTAREHLVDIGATDVRQCDPVEVVREQYGCAALLTTLG